MEQAQRKRLQFHRKSRNMMFCSHMIWEMYGTNADCNEQKVRHSPTKTMPTPENKPRTRAKKDDSHTGWGMAVALFPECGLHYCCTSFCIFVSEIVFSFLNLQTNQQCVFVRSRRVVVEGLLVCDKDMEVENRG